MAKGTTKSSTDDIFANSLTQARNEIAKLLTPYLKILKLETKGPMTIEALDKVLQQLPPTDSLARELKSLEDHLRNVRRGLAAQLEEQFCIAFTDFIRKEQEQEPRPREVASSTWRIGRLAPAIHFPEVRQDRGILDVEQDPSRQRIRIRYDGEEILGWSSAANLDDIDGLVDSAYKLLETCAIPKDQLPPLFAAAYEACEEERGRSGCTDPGLVPILDFGQQVRIAMDRQVLQKKGPWATLPIREFKKYAFLYNLDRYQVLQHGQEGPPRLSLETGVQATIREGKCVLVSSQGQDLRQCCFIRKVAK